MWRGEIGLKSKARATERVVSVIGSFGNTSGRLDAQPFTSR
jgi:hypothetical protein